jgi:hypothetical protein
MTNVLGLEILSAAMQLKSNPATSPLVQCVDFIHSCRVFGMSFLSLLAIQKCLKKHQKHTLTEMSAPDQSCNTSSGRPRHGFTSQCLPDKLFVLAKRASFSVGDSALCMD